MPSAIPSMPIIVRCLTISYPYIVQRLMISNTISFKTSLSISLTYSTNSPPLTIVCLHICHEKARVLGIFYNESLTDSI